jgi:hypothetical protein
VYRITKKKKSLISNGVSKNILQNLDYSQEGFATDFLKVGSPKLFKNVTNIKIIKKLLE